MDYLGKVQRRLQGVVIENKDFENLISVYDRKDALFYLDPPYVGTERYYSAAFSMKDHERLADVLKHIKGKFVLSYNNVAWIHELYSQYPCKEVTRNNTLAGNASNRERYKEVIITNF